MTEPKRCPFCGTHGDESGCINPGCPISTIWFPKDYWNSRPIEDELSARIKELEAEIVFICGDIGKAARQR